MHYLVGVILPFKYEGEKLSEAIGEILKPWYEEEWDWYQLGGRYTGVWSDYNPTKDPANFEVCWLCQGTGLRNDPAGQQQRKIDPAYTCNGCGYDQGPQPGIMVKHATSWVRRPDDDVIPVATLIEKDRLPYAIAIAPKTWLAVDTWNGNDIVDTPDYEAKALSLLNDHRDCWVAAVDVHN